MTEFGRLNPDGSYEHVRNISQAAMRGCAFSIMVPEHYRADETCRCDDPTHGEMWSWGYRWNDKIGMWT